MLRQEAKLLHLIEAEIARNRLILPSLPEVALRVRELTADEACSPAELEKEIAKDAAITARLLKVANSSALHSGKTLSSLRQAITRLGLNLVRSLVTQLSILQAMQSGQDNERLRGFVASSLRISAICHTLAEGQRHLDAEQAALAGLVHDIGKLPLRQFTAQHERLRNNKPLNQLLEQDLHPAVGALLLRHWKFPEELVRVAEEHESLERNPDDEADYTDLVIAANLLHYGTETGRYAHLAGKTIPALEKCCGEAGNSSWGESLEQRMEMSLTLISA